MRILQVLSHFGTGGVTTVVIEWLRHLQHADHQIDICTVLTKGPKAAQLEELGYTIYDLGFSPGYEKGHPRRKYDTRAVTLLASLIREGGYDIVHTHLFPVFYFGSLESIKEAVRLICHNSGYREKLEQGAREYYLTYLKPSQVIERILKVAYAK